MYSVSISWFRFISLISLISFLAQADISPDSVYNCGSGVSALSCDDNMAVFEQLGTIKCLNTDSLSVDTIGSGGSPSIEIPYIVWDSSVGGYDQVFVHDILQSQSFQLTSGNNDKSDADVSGQNVVYRYKGTSDSLWHIGLTEFSGLAAGNTLDICTAAGGQYGPRIDGDIVVWYDKRNVLVSGRDIYQYNLNTSAETILCDDAGDQRLPVISGDIAGWQDDSKGADDLDIYGYIISEDRKLSLATQTGSQSAPRASGDILLWINNAVESPGVYVFDFSTYSKYRIASGSGLIADVCEDMLCWYDGTNINKASLPLQTPLTVVSPSVDDVFISGESISIEWTNSNLSSDVDLMYSSDGGENWAIVASSLNGVTSFDWQAPEEANSSSLIAVCYSDQSDDMYCSGIFSTTVCSPDLTADISGDCFVGLEDLGMLSAQWMSSGL
ncbi:MAG: hypothetical protein ACIAQZ_08745 [Sedimentisphaeraceae bacterium JB056]